MLIVGRNSSDGIATRYGLEGPGIECRWRRDFRHSFRQILGPTQPPRRWVPGLFPRGLALTTHTPSNAKVKERVEIYIDSPAEIL